MGRTRDIPAHAARLEAILDVAERLFAERGFHQTGMAAICEAAGMSPGALYRYVSSKSDLILKIVQREQAAAIASFAQLDGAGDFPEVLVDLMVDSIAETSDPHYATLALEIAAEGTRDAAVGRILAEAHSALVEGLASAITSARAAGEVGDVDAVVVSHLLIAIVDGTMAAAPATRGLSRDSLRTTLSGLVEGLLRVS